MSIRSESSIYDSDIVQEQIDEYERNQRLRQYGLLPDISEEREIDLIDSFRDAGFTDHSDRLRILNELQETEENELSIGGKLKKLSKIDKRKCLILFITLLITTTLVSFGILWLMKRKTHADEDLSTTLEITTISTTVSVTGTQKTTKASTSTPQPVQHRKLMNLNECISYNDPPIYSDKDCFKLVFGKDGKLAIIREADKKIAWKSLTKNAIKACLMDDGNFVLMGENDEILWSAQTANLGATHLQVGDGGILRVLTADNQTVYRNKFPIFTIIC